MRFSIVNAVYDDLNNINDIISMSLNVHRTSMPPFTFSAFGRRWQDVNNRQSFLFLLFIGTKSDHWLPLLFDDVATVTEGCEKLF